MRGWLGLAVLAALASAACQRPHRATSHQLATPEARFTLSASGHLGAYRASAPGPAPDLDLDLDQDRPAPQLIVDGERVDDVPLDVSQPRAVAPRAIDGLKGRALEFAGTGTGRLEGLAKTVRLELYDELPRVAFLQITYDNTGAQPMRLERLIPQRWRLAARAQQPPLWSFHGSSARSREEAILPLTPGFARANRMGAMAENGRGGGLPLVAFWSRQSGAAWGHAETGPRILSLPVSVEASGQVSASIEIDAEGPLLPGASYTTPLLFVSVFGGDYYEALRDWVSVLSRRGLSTPAPRLAAYEPSWCGWGYGPGITPGQMLGALPAVARLGFRWATLDEGWFSNYGDGEPREDFGRDGIRRVVNAFHRRKIHMQLWWLPLAVEGGHRAEGRRRREARVAREHPDWLILDADGRTARTFGDFALMCPAVPAVQEYHRQLTRRFIGEWGFDGLKLDKVFTVPPCYNPAHGHRRPAESVERLGEVLGTIYKTAHELRHDCVVQICPCASLPNLAWLPFVDQPVTADPDGAAQVRWRTKVYKALYGPRAPVYGDHVELTASRWHDGRQVTFGSDFASAVGVGAVPGTRFVWPPLRALADVSLPAERERHFAKWLNLYRAKRLAEGEFRNLYVHGFDWPEGYAIEQGGSLYYAFFAKDGTPHFQGALELRGLTAGRSYRVFDYEREQDLGRVSGPTGRLEVRFKRRLLLRTSPE